MRVTAAALAVLIAAAPPTAAAQDKLPVVTTTADLKSLVEAVGGDRVDVEHLASPEQDPHSIEIKPGQLTRLRRAKLLVRVGLDHEPWLARFPIRPMDIVDASKSVKLLQTETPRLRTESKAHVHSFGNTHYWLDPHHGGAITASILAALIKLSPSDKEYFEARRAAFVARLDERIKAWEATLAPYRGIRVVVVHDSWSYFAQRFGLQIVAAAEPQPGIPPSPAELAALFQRMRETKVRIVIADPYANPALVRQIEERSGAKAVTLLPSGFDYVDLFEENVKRLLAALRKD